MKSEEIRRVEAYLRRTFKNDDITIAAPPRSGGSCEVSVGGEFVGTLNRDEDEGEVSYDFNMVILDLDI
jgi:hypothetical protein